MPKSNLSVYIPRNDNEAYEELKTKQLPIELKEQLQIIDSYPELIEKLNQSFKEFLTKIHWQILFVCPNYNYLK